MANNADTTSQDVGELSALHPDMKHEENHESPELSVGEIRPLDSAPPTVSQLMKCKTHEWEDTKKKGVPLTLLGLPVDVLSLILTYTNDLNALALTHSALYKLAIPFIYSRFDIVWPDATAHSLSSKGVDALSYGLSTLCLPNRFAETAQRSRGTGLGGSRISHRLMNNNHAQYIRKFSIGDGPSEWTSEYFITKESGKMLGTLVAIAVSKMVNLETFVWDMPTGVLSDVFMALASLKDDQGQSKLEKVWVRWHDSPSTTPSSTSSSSPTTALPALNPPSQLFASLVQAGPIGNYVQASADGATPQFKSYSQSCAEYPTFSILPPLRSLTVLDIDDLAYLDEMSMLIERSAAYLRELQVGISTKAYSRHDFAQPWDGSNLQQVDHEAKWPGESRIPTTRLGGVLGVLVGRIYDIRRKPSTNSHESPASGQNTEGPSDAKASDEAKEETKREGKAPQPQKSIDTEIPNPFLGRKRLDGKLKLEKLALERVTLSIAVCSRALDWSNMTSLTILNCRHHDSLWKTLRRQFQPTAPPKGGSLRYYLSLKHIYTDLASPALVSFMKETIAPDTMESIFLLDRQTTPKPSVSLDQIFRCTAKRHKNSLKKLLIDSSETKATSAMLPGSAGRWRHWAIKDTVFSYITSSRMTSLRELGMVIEYKDWHTLLQRLPQMANLRSLYIPYMLGHHSRPVPAAKELALQIVDVISLRREIRLAYVGLWHKCFEVTEVEGGSSAQDNNDHFIYADSVDHSDEDETDEDEEDPINNTLFGGDFMDEFVEEGTDDSQSEADSFIEETTNKPLPRLRLREILYYDDKVDLFRARHGKL
ncbi:hypothetical protein O1611_g1023 [Lasiodiplodia mahajangana]|uniref:Uncharacterized protein n=1 Tax=Lasiodiplodia mahajangana TaxID=1108764 RepID=A0ACC2JYQ6_9PEZI|nr:hypothetical protein O1611_g1023 [Lasiodiplodia mahajangana]